MSRCICLVCCVMAALAGSLPGNAEEISRSFEFRYVTDNPAANGVTDFKGETAIFDTDERIAFLGRYAEYASEYYNDPELDTEVVSDDEVQRALDGIKAQPLPSVRRRIPLERWVWAGYRDGLSDERAEEYASWEKKKGVTVSDGNLVCSSSKVSIVHAIPEQAWRFALSLSLTVPDANGEAEISLGSSDAVCCLIGFKGDMVYYRSGGTRIDAGTCKSGTQHTVRFEADCDERRYNVFIDNELRADFVPFDENGVNSVDRLTIAASRNVTADDIIGTGYEATGDDSAPFKSHTFIDEKFSLPPNMNDWQQPGYNDSAWDDTTLPHVHGGERHAGESLYLRTGVTVDKCDRAVLNAETIDPGGEIWVNGAPVAVITDRHPVSVDITDYLDPGVENCIAVRVKPGYSKTPMHHAPADRNIGWFAGRMWIDMTPKVYIGNTFASTSYIAEHAGVQSSSILKNETPEPFYGTVTVSMYPWFPRESSVPAVSKSFPVRVRAWGDYTLEQLLILDNPEVWTSDNSNLYRMHVELADTTGTIIDDSVFTTGVRTVRQDGGTFRINGKPEMLNGAQIMGFRIPIENNALWNRCAPAEWLMKELLLVKRMNGNLLRVHVHAWQGPDGGINDPRIAEIADQLGIMLIWSTTAWIRSLEGFAIDFDGYQKYMRQVYNHPSIVMWEASNHPNRFKRYDQGESDAFVKKVYETIYSIDKSRLISLTSFIKHLHYGNDLGTVDYMGNSITAPPAWTGHKVVRGNQDSFTGYGREWSEIREFPNSYYREFLGSSDRAYFNFEHEESIGQPNWKFSRGKPYYKLQSYEWDYDTGSIGRHLTVDEWRESQAWQAFSAYESMKKQRLFDYDGFSWCCLHGGANSGTYKKPLLDNFCHAKLAYWVNGTVFQKVFAGSSDVDVVYGPGDEISPVIMNLGTSRTVDCSVTVKTADGKTVETKTYLEVTLPSGRTVTKLPAFKPSFTGNGYYAVEYTVTE